MATVTVTTVKTTTVFVPTVDKYGLTCFGVDFPTCHCAGRCPDAMKCEKHFTDMFAAELMHWMAHAEGMDNLEAWLAADM